MSGLLVRLSNLALVTTLVKRAQIAIDAIQTNAAIGPDLRSLLARSRGLFVAPDVMPGALILSGGCGGVLMARAPDGSDWNGPSFHLLGGVALGRELGGRSSTIFLLAMTDHGVSALLSNDSGMGGGARINAVPLSRVDPDYGDPDILGFALSEDACSSPSFDRAVIIACDGLNHAVYGRDVTPEDVIIRGTPRGVDSAGLHRALGEAATNSF